MKKKFDIKYNLKDEVFFLHNNEIIKDKIIKYRISVEEPFSISQDDVEFTEHSGIIIEYFFIILKNNIKFFNFKEIDMREENFDFVWINQNDVYKTEEELMEKL